jgi:hypothetical protein
MVRASTKVARLRRSNTKETVIMTKIRRVLLGAAIVGSLFSFLPTAASAFQATAEQRAACLGDALSLCSAAIPSTDRVFACLASKKSQLSASCRAQFDKLKS